MLTIPEGKFRGLKLSARGSGKLVNIVPNYPRSDWNDGQKFRPSFFFFLEGMRSLQMAERGVHHAERAMKLQKHVPAFSWPRDTVNELTRENCGSLVFQRLCDQCLVLLRFTYTRLLIGQRSLSNWIPAIAVIAVSLDIVEIACRRSVPCEPEKF